MRVFSRPISGWGIHNHPVIHIREGAWGCERPGLNAAAAMAESIANMSGPAYQGMDPSDPATWVRPFNPVLGMISVPDLNADGAQLQGRTPTQLRRGPQSRPRRLRIEL